MCALWLCVSAALVLGIQIQSADAGSVTRQVTAAYTHAEGPVWDSQHGVLLYVDIAGQTMHRYTPSTDKVQGLFFDDAVSLIIPIKDTENTYAVGVGRDLVRISVDWDQVGDNTTASNYSVIASVQANSTGNRFNDGKADDDGRIWAGTMGPEEVVGEVTPYKGQFYRIAPDEEGVYQVTVEIDNVSISNGLAWSKNRTLLYYIDTNTRRVDMFDFNELLGTIANRRPAFDFEVNNITGNPDGMTIDSDDNIWVACFGGAQVGYIKPDMNRLACTIERDRSGLYSDIRQSQDFFDVGISYSSSQQSNVLQADPSTGKVLQLVPIPAQQVTSVAFGGSDLSTLYVTTMRKGLSAEELKQQPLAGSVFAVTGLGVTGQSQSEGSSSGNCQGPSTNYILIATLSLYLVLKAAFYRDWL